MHFSASAAETFHAIAHQPLYRVRIFEKSMEDRTVGCVVLGESHIKFSARRKQMVVSLFHQFPFQAVEGAEGNQNLEMQLFGFLISPFHRVIDRVGYGSLVYDAARWQFEHVLEDQAALTMLIKGNQLQGMTEEALRSKEIVLSLGKHEKVVTGLEIMNAWQALQGKKQGVYGLEENHHPGLHERISTGIIFGLGVAALAGMGLPLISPHTAHELLGTVSEKILPFAEIHAGGVLASAFFPGHARLKRILNPILGGLIYGRDETMARNINALLNDAPDQAILLATMGLWHTQGVSYLLKGTYGFTEVALPPVDEA
ncbi:MAG: hypothetical protein HY540_00180 [Deltaproteobacteria bacterium]|nr:hypothetical protein [Deltaproteobacteria bacterium]